MNRNGPATTAWTDGIHLFQFERLGYFCMDPKAQGLFNHSVSLKD